MQNDRVTPVLGKLIENIMAERPADPAQYIVRYLTKSDSMAASASHWDALTTELAEAKNAAAPPVVNEEVSIPIESFKAISSALDPFEAQEAVIVESCGLLNCDRASIFLLDEITQELVLHVAKGAQEIRIPRTAGIAGECAEKGEVMMINDPYSDPRFNQATDKATGYTTTSILATPIRDAEANIIGVMQAINKGGTSGFTDGDQSLVEKLSVLAGISVRNAVVHEEMKASDAKTKSLVEVVKSVSGNMGLNSVIFTITQKCPALVECEAATMYLIDLKRKQLWSIATDTGKEFRVPLEGTIAGFVGDTGKVVNIPDCYTDAAEQHEVLGKGSKVRPVWNGQAFDVQTGFKTQNMLVLPIMIGGWNDFEPFNKEVVGVLQLINKTSKKPDGFGHEDEDVLESFLGIVATIVKSSFVFESLGKDVVSEAAAVFGQGPTHLQRRPSVSGAQTMETFREMGISEADNEIDEDEEEGEEEEEEEDENEE